jgi:hypothetical protein
MTEEINLAALIVRNIGDVEATIAKAQGELDTRFLEEVEQAAQRASGQVWDAMCENKEDMYLTKKDWMNSNDDEGADFWLQFGEIPDGNGETNLTWIATATESGPSGATFALSFNQELITPAKFKVLLNSHPELVIKLRGYKFQRDASGRWLSIPINIDRDALAQAFATDNFDVALKPVSDAVHDATRAMSDLDTLVNLMR